MQQLYPGNDFSGNGILGAGKKLKKKKKREAKKKARKGARLQARRREEAFYLADLAHSTWDTSEALDLIKKAHKLLPDHDGIEIDLILYAERAGDNDLFFKTLLRRFGKGRPCFPPYMLTVAKRLLEERRYAYAIKVAEYVLDAIDLWEMKNRRSVRAGANRVLKQASKALQVETASRMPATARAGKSASQRKPGEGKSRPSPASRAGRYSRTAGNIAEHEKQYAETPSPGASGDDTVSSPGLSIEVEYQCDEIVAAIKECRRASLDDYELLVAALDLSFHSSYDQLLCIPTLNGVKSMWHQEETARKVLKDFRGRALLADEVGLGKTIEAGMVLKEYYLRGLVKNALVLAPTSLVGQWREELKTKFGMDFVTTSDPAMARDPAAFWKQPFIVASLNTAKSKKNFDMVVSRNYDMVIVDEAHHLKNRTTLNWKLVNSLKKTFILMLTATPVQNRLEELYNLITLLKPGQLKTLKAFKEEFVTRGDPAMPQNRLKLRSLLKDVMIRNTRSVANIRIPPREAFTVRVKASPEEEALYNGLSDLVTASAASRARGMNRLMLRTLLEVAGSSHAAAAVTMERMLSRGSTAGHEEAISNLLSLARRITDGSKARELLELLKSMQDQAIIFVRFTETLRYLEEFLKAAGVRLSTFHGSMNPAQKEEVIERFRSGKSRVLLSTESGGEGRNLQFCHVMVNYDLPWNPMQIEQRIGRIHRIGQEEVVQIYNFCAAGSLEDHILFILDRKINMFELVVGEVDMILGRLRGEKEFADRVFEIWTKSSDARERKKGFDALGRQLKRARTSYDINKELDEKLFGEDFEL